MVWSRESYCAGAAKPARARTNFHADLEISGGCHGVQQERVVAIRPLDLRAPPRYHERSFLRRVLLRLQREMHSSAHPANDGIIPFEAPLQKETAGRAIALTTGHQTAGGYL